MRVLCGHPGPNVIAHASQPRGIRHDFLRLPGGRRTRRSGPQRQVTIVVPVRAAGFRPDPACPPCSPATWQASTGTPFVVDQPGPAPAASTGTGYVGQARAARGRHAAGSGPSSSISRFMPGRSLTSQAALDVDRDLHPSPHNFVSFPKSAGGSESQAKANNVPSNHPRQFDRLPERRTKAKINLRLSFRPRHFPQQSLGRDCSERANRENENDAVRSGPPPDEVSTSMPGRPTSSVGRSTA